MLVKLPKQVFLIGVGGTAMGNLAVCLRNSGVSVQGSDSAVYPPMSHLLAAHSIPVFSPDDVAIIEDSRESLFVVGNAVSRGHAQVEWLMKHPEVERCSFPEFLGNRLLRHTKNLVVAGTHGKSTSTAIASYLMEEGCIPAAWFVGGVFANGHSAFSWKETDQYFAIEGDEYDSAFFDKRSKFVHYRPEVLLLNNLEFDHADIFRDTADVQRSFRQVISLVPENGCILYNGDDPHLCSILPVQWTHCRTFGFGEENDFVISRRSGEGESELSIRSNLDDVNSFTLRTRLLGEFNARNAVGAALAVRYLCPQLGDALVDIRDFMGLKRRQEVRYGDSRHILIEDFGHHPTALGEALKAIRESYAGWRIHAMVEPRSNTMRTNKLQADLIKALCEADSVTIAPIHRADRIQQSERLDVDEVIRELRGRSVPCHFCAEDRDLVDCFQNGLKDERVVTVVFSNGAFCGLLEEFCEILQG